MERKEQGYPEYIELQEFSPSEIPYRIIELEKTTTWQGKKVVYCKNIKDALTLLVVGLLSGLLLGALSAFITLPMKIKHTDDNQVIATIETIAEILIPAGIQSLLIINLKKRVDLITMSLEMLTGTITGITMAAFKIPTTLFSIESIKIVATASGAGAIVGASIEMIKGAWAKRRTNPVVN